MRSIPPAFFLLLAFVLSSCSQQTPSLATESQTPGFSGTLRLYQTQTSTPTTTPPLFKSPTPTATATPTATPLTYTVRAKDDMFGIAYAFGISPQALMTANPTVDPRAMSIGTVLIIPVTPSPPGNTATPTITPSATPAIANILHQPVCYPVAGGGLWCFLLVKNPGETGLENVTGTINLSYPGKDKPSQATATTLLDLLPGGESAPLVAYFPAQTANSYTASGQVTSALPQPANDQRYLSAGIQNQQVNFSEDGKSANLSGNIVLRADNVAANQIWIAATAYTKDSVVAGVRKWEASGPLKSGAPLPFDFDVYSLGPVIDHVTLQVQARP